LSARHLVTAALLAAAVSVPAGVGAQTPAGDRLLPVEQHTTENGRQLARTHAAALRALAASIYHCIPWVETEKGSIGFFHPKHLQGDERYLSLRLYIEQDPTPEFAALRVEDRAASMFSRYVGPMLQRMTRDPALKADANVNGYTVILEWLKQGTRGPKTARPVHESIAVFADRETALAYLGGGMGGAELARRARVYGFDGETALGVLTLAAWDDDFVATFRPKNYQLASGVTCP
jgi:hypothetical protein